MSTSKHPRPLLTEQKSNYCECEQPQNTKADSSENADGIGCGSVNMRGSEEEGWGVMQLSNRGGGTASLSAKKKKEVMKKEVDVEEMRGEERKGEMSNGA